MPAAGGWREAARLLGAVGVVRGLRLERGGQTPLARNPAYFPLSPRHSIWLQQGNLQQTTGHETVFAATPWGYQSYMMLFSPLIASTTGIGSRPSPGPIKDRCGVEGVVPHSYMVTLRPPLASGSTRRSAPMSDANEGGLSFLHGWFQQYEEDASNGTSRRKLEAGSNATRAVHYFTQTQLAVAIEASDEVHSGPARTNPRLTLPLANNAPMSRETSQPTPMCRASCPPRRTTCARSHRTSGCHARGHGSGRLLD